jgi:hypothetical protein
VGKGRMYNQSNDIHHPWRPDQTSLSVSVELWLIESLMDIIEGCHRSAETIGSQ